MSLYPSAHPQSVTGEGSVPVAQEEVTWSPTGTDFEVHPEAPEGPRSQGRESGSNSILRGVETDSGVPSERNRATVSPPDPPHGSRGFVGVPLQRVFPDPENWTPPVEENGEPQSVPYPVLLLHQPPLNQELSIMEGMPRCINPLKREV